MLRLTFFIPLVLALCGCNKVTATPNQSAQTDSLAIVSNDSVTAETSVPASYRPLTFAFVGDIMMGTTYPETPAGAYLAPNDGADLFGSVKDLISSADIAAGNLEGTLLDGQGRVKKCGNPDLCYAFRMPTRYAKHLTDAGFDFLGIANNHINDFGPDGLTSTRRTLKDNGLLFAGLRDGCRTAITEVDGRKIGFAAFGHNQGTPSIMNMEEVKSTVSGLRKECDIIVVSFHGGGEGANFTHVPHAMEQCFGEQRGNVEAFAHAAIDAGADVVYGHGPHVTRAMELYKDHLIMYSLGNFCTPYRVNLKGINGHAPVVTVNLNPDGTFAGGKIHSFIQSPGTGPRPDTTNSVARQIRTLSNADFPASPLKIADDGTLSR